MRKGRRGYLSVESELIQQNVELSQTVLQFKTLLLFIYIMKLI
jgi:hypothetical protein